MKLFGNYSLKSTHFLLKKIKVLKRFSPNVFGLTSPFKKKESKKKKKKTGPITTLLSSLSSQIKSQFINKLFHSDKKNREDEGKCKVTNPRMSYTCFIFKTRIIDFLIICPVFFFKGAQKSGRGETN